MGEECAVAGFIVGQVQASGQLGGGVQRRFERAALLGSEKLVAHAELGEHGARGRRDLDLLLGAEELQVAGRLFVFDGMARAQRPQLLLAVEREPLHAGAIAPIALHVALPEPAPYPPPESRAQAGPEDDRRFRTQQVVEHLAWHARRGPRADIAGRHDAGVGEARFLRDAGAALEHRDIESGATQGHGQCRRR